MNECIIGILVFLAVGGCLAIIAYRNAEDI